jgi:hypothetical protein
VVVLIAVLAAGGGDDDKTASSGASEGEIFLESASSPGPEVFTEPVSTPTSTTITAPTTSSSTTTTVPGAAQSIATTRGDSVGLYGGTRNLTSCDVDKMVTFLTVTDEAKGRAWADVEGISFNELTTYLRSLTSVILRSDTRVTNHGYRNGRATTRQSVLQAGTAVLVDHFGVPRARCYCGNPLTTPVAVTVRPRYSGDQWSGFEPTNVTVVQQSTVVINNFTLIDVYTGEPFGRPPGGTGGTDGPPPTPSSSTTTSSSSTTTTTAPPAQGKPASPSEIPGRYTAAGVSGTCNGQRSQGQPTGGVSFTVAVNGSTLTITTADGSAESMPFNPADASFGGESKPGDFFKTRFRAQFVRAGGGVELRYTIEWLDPPPCTTVFTARKQ